MAIPHRFHFGFTLIELLMVLAISVIITCCAVAYMQPNIQKNQTQLLANNLLHHLQYARLEAIKRNQIVSLCGSQDAQTCSPHWDKGYLIYTENEGIKHIIKTNDYYHIPNIKIIGQFNNHPNHIRFTPSGKSKDNGRITISSIEALSSDPNERAIVVFHSGRARFA